MTTALRQGSPFLFDSSSGDMVGVRDEDGSEKFFLASPAAQPVAQMVHFTGVANVFFGEGAGNLSLTTAQSCTGMGKFALQDVTSGVNLCAFGAGAMANMTTAQDSVALGGVSMSNGTTVNWGTAAGHASLLNVDGASYPTAYGYQSAMSVTTAARITAIGPKALLSLTTGAENVGLGWEAGTSLTTATGNTALGSYSLKNCLTGNFNLAAGYQAGEDCTGTNNVFLGPICGVDYTSGGNNVFIGRDSGNATIALSPARTGAQNTAIGSGSGPTAAAANNTTCVGYQATCNQSNSIAIGYLVVNSVVSGLTTKIGLGYSDANISGRLHYSVTVSSVANAAGVTYSNAEFRGGLILRSGAPGAGFSDTTPAASALVSLIPGCEVGTGYELLIQNSTGQTMTLVAGTGMTLSGTTTVLTGQTRRYLVRFTNVTAASEAATIYGVSTAAS